MENHVPGHIVLFGGLNFDSTVHVIYMQSMVYTKCSIDVNYYYFSSQVRSGSWQELYHGVAPWVETLSAGLEGSSLR